MDSFRFTTAHAVAHPGHVPFLAELSSLVAIFSPSLSAIYVVQLFVELFSLCSRRQARELFMFTIPVSSRLAKSIAFPFINLAKASPNLMFGVIGCEVIARARRL